MPLLLVDDRDGRIVAEIQSEDEALRILEAMSGDEVPEYLCLVDCQSRRGTLLGTDTTVKIRALSQQDSGLS